MKYLKLFEEIENDDFYWEDDVQSESNGFSEDDINNSRTRKT